MRQTSSALEMQQNFCWKQQVPACWALLNRASIPDPAVAQHSIMTQTWIGEAGAVAAGLVTGQHAGFRAAAWLVDEGFVCIHSTIFTFGAPS